MEPFENCGDESFLVKTDARTIVLALDLDAEELVCRAEIGDLLRFLKPGHNFDRSFSSIYWLQY
jgi:hypothetical protein